MRIKVNQSMPDGVSMNFGKKHHKDVNVTQIDESTPIKLDATSDSSAAFAVRNL